MMDANQRWDVDEAKDGAKTALPVGVACAVVGIIIGTMTLTGAANTFGQFIVSVGESNLFLSLVLTMITCIVLGMGVPVTAPPPMSGGRVRSNRSLQACSVEF